MRSKYDRVTILIRRSVKSSQIKTHEHRPRTERQAMQASGARAVKEGRSTRVPVGEHAYRRPKTEEKMGRRPDQRGGGSQCVGGLKPELRL